MEADNVPPVMSGSGYRFGRYVIDLANRRVLLDGVPVGLPWRCFDALVLLVNAHDAVVDREILFRKLWPGIEVEETSLTKVMSQLRRIVAEGDPSVEYIETVPRLGYRLGVPVLLDNAIHAANQNGAAPVSAAPGAANTASSRRRLVKVNRRKPSTSANTAAARFRTTRSTGCLNAALERSWCRAHCWLPPVEPLFASWLVLPG